KQNEMSVAAERRWLQELSRLLSNKQMNDKQKIDKATELMQRYTYSSFINIVEEPEQNLYPTSQKQALFGLLSASNGRPDNRLLLTTHSPYIISYLNISLEAAKIYSSLNSDKSAIEKKHRVSSICPQVSAVNAERVNTYEFKSDGSVSELGKYDGVLQDANQLNNELDQLNSLFSDLLEI
ncbi:MAG: ATP-binding protein, partial [Gammaproteobacteria bacterium]|nr:ATP-binding protein [Gammaproteobacteria bacterium]